MCMFVTTLPGVPAGSSIGGTGTGHARCLSPVITKTTFWPYVENIVVQDFEVERLRQCGIRRAEQLHLVVCLWARRHE